MRRCCLKGQVSKSAVVGSARVDIEQTIEIGGVPDGEGRPKLSCSARPFFRCKWLGSSLSIAGRKWRIATTLSASLDFCFQKGIWVRILQKDVVEVKEMNWRQ